MPPINQPQTGACGPMAPGNGLTRMECGPQGALQSVIEDPCPQEINLKTVRVAGLFQHADGRRGRRICFVTISSRNGVCPLVFCRHIAPMQHGARFRDAFFMVFNSRFFVLNFHIDF